MPQTRLITYNGRTDILSGWSAKTGLSSQTIVKRLHAGWSVKDALTSPLYQRGGEMRKRRIVAKPIPVAAIATVLMPALEEYQRQHRAVEVRMTRMFNEFIQSCARRDTAIMRDIDTRSVGQPPAGTLKTPGVVDNLSKELPDRSLSVAPDSL